MEKFVIRTENLSKIYTLGSESVCALKDISFNIPAGQIVCVLGSSGSGKSTLLNQLAGLERPTRGRVFLGKRNISIMSENSLAAFRQNHVGFVFQSYNLLSFLTATENVALPLTFKGIDDKQRTSAANSMLDEVGILDRKNHLPSQMSGGQQQRVGIARAFVANPKIVFADEPTGNLDSKTATLIMEMIVALCRKNNQTLILVTHNEELSFYADRIMVISDGVIIEDKTIKKEVSL